jgi:hypothetical protein
VCNISTKGYCSDRANFNALARSASVFAIVCLRKTQRLILRGVIKTLQVYAEASSLDELASAIGTPLAFARDVVRMLQTVWNGQLLWDSFSFSMNPIE